MWIPSEDEAVDMFARQFLARHKIGAAGQAEETASALKAHGDENGFRIWEKVALRLKELQRRRPDRRAA